MPIARRATTLALLVLAVGCSEKGRSLVLVNLSLSSNVTSIAQARVVVVQGPSDIVGRETVSWTGTPSPLDLGVFVSKDVTGVVQVIACGLDNNGVGVATASPASTSVAPGATTSAIAFVLSGGAPSALCASGASDGGTDAGGAAGTGGSAGTGGVTGASGMGGKSGADGGAGAGGASGAGGAGGASGMAGAAGTGGASGMGGAAGGHVPAWLGAHVVAGDPALDESIPAVAVSASGAAVVVYDRAGGLWANTFDATAGSWGTTPHMIDGRSGADQGSVAVDKTGHYLAVWQQDQSAAYKGIWWSSSGDGVTWTPAASLTTTTAASPVLSMNADGAAIVAWTEQTQDGQFNLQAGATVRSSTSAAWSAPQVLRPGDDQGDRNPAVAMSGKGEAFVMWEQSDGQATDWNSIWWRQHTTTGWSAAALFESYDSQSTYNPSVATNAAGQAIATWVQVAADASGIQIWSRRYTFGAGFGMPIEVTSGSDLDTIFPPSLTLDESGVATVAWAFGIQGKFDVYTNRAGPTDATWPAATAMESDNAATNDDDTDPTAQSPIPIVRNDPNGNVTLVWRKRVGKRFDLWGRRATAGGVWGSSTQLETRDLGSVQWPALGVGADGTAVAAWYYDVELDVWANVFR